LVGAVAVQPNATSVQLYPFSWNRIEIFLVLPERESHQQKAADSLADSAASAQTNQWLWLSVITKINRSLEPIP
jgi:hypothetical protein